jgi:hypothetical protein
MGLPWRHGAIPAHLRAFSFDRPDHPQTVFLGSLFKRKQLFLPDFQRIFLHCQATIGLLVAVGAE